MLCSDSQPLISVIVPVYNAKQYLVQCLESLLSQTYTNLQIICVNDGSTDGSSTILQNFAKRDSRITVLNQQNRGPGVTRNVGLTTACGEWITGLDADDYLESDALEYAMGMQSEDIDIVCYSSVVESPSETRAEEYDYLSNAEDTVLTSPREIMERVNVYFWNKLWRKSFIVQNGLRFAEDTWYEDSAFAYCAFPFARAVACGGRKVHHYRMHQQSIMTQTFNSHPRSIEHLDILDKILSFYSLHNVESRYPEAPAHVFRLLFGATMAHIPTSLKKEALTKAARIADVYDLRRKFPHEGCINAARWIPWYLRPFFKSSYSKREYRFFWIPIYTERLSAKLKCSSIRHSL